MVWKFCETGRQIEEVEGEGEGEGEGGGGATIGCHGRDASLLFIGQGCQAELWEMKGNKSDERRGGKG